MRRNFTAVIGVIIPIISHVVVIIPTIIIIILIIIIIPTIWCPLLNCFKLQLI